VRFLKLALLHVAKAVGVFALCRRVTSSGLRILCWHGFTVEDEHRFRPPLFSETASFRRRIEWLRRKHFRIMPLDEAVRGLAEGALPRDATVLTFDDGWATSMGEPVEILAGLPATFYVITSYVDRPEPIFSLICAYALWKTGQDRVELDGERLTLDELGNRARAGTLDDRIILARKIARWGGVDFDAIQRDRRFGIVTSDEIRELQRRGFDVQLHTHRHQWHRDRALAEREIDENRALLETVTGRRLTHFCYPGGVHFPENFAHMAGMGIASATTCVRSFNYPGDNPLALGRILDGSSVAQIEFEAAVCGVYEALRLARVWLNALLRPRSRSSEQVAMALGPAE
jgi:peptidoglycan/xylan/chitin deacetylase (PgdA/CDA1 family)